MRPLNRHHSRILTLALVLAGVLAGASVAAAQPGEATSPPHVVKMEPANRAVDVPPGPGEIRITFSEPMKDGGWSITGGGPTFPKITAIAYDATRTLLTVKVVLKPGWTYRFGLNSPSHRSFVSAKGVPLEPILASFRTSGKAEPEDDTEPTGPVVEFDLEDVNDLRVRSQDYAGVPIFLAFGAAW